MNGFAAGDLIAVILIVVLLTVQGVGLRRKVADDATHARRHIDHVLSAAAGRRRAAIQRRRGGRIFEFRGSRIIVSVGVHKTGAVKLSLYVLILRPVRAEKDVVFDVIGVVAI